MDFSKNTLQLAQYTLRFRVLSPIVFNDYAGSALRGAFGHALMLISGIEKSDVQNKRPCYLYSAYAAVFEPVANYQNGLLSCVSDMPVSYIIKAPTSFDLQLQVGEFLEFDIVLLGKALEHLSSVVLAWRRALLHGIGRESAGKAELCEVLFHGNDKKIPVYSEKRPVLSPHNAVLSVPVFKQSEDVHLIFNTALRLRVNGKIAGLEALTPSLLLRNLIRRVSFCLQLEQSDSALVVDIDYLNQLADQVKGDNQLTFKKWRRYSSRQGRTMELNGWVGHWILYDVPAALLPFIWLGQFLHVGKNTSFGLGGYEISQREWVGNPARKNKEA